MFWFPCCTPNDVGVGCRFLQKELDSGPERVTAIFEEVYEHMSQLMIGAWPCCCVTCLSDGCARLDPFGNYLCQKLFAKCDHEQRLQILQTISPKVVSVSLNMHGTRAVQSVVKSLDSDEQVKLMMKSLERYFMCGLSLARY